MLSGQDLSIYVYSLEFGIGKGYFYCIEINQCGSNFRHIYFFSLFPSYIYSFHIDYFFNFSAILIFPLLPIGSIDLRVI